MTTPSPTGLAELAHRLQGPLLIGRAAAGLVMVTAPTIVASTWLGIRSRPSRRFVRVIGIRDLVICAAQLRADPRASVRWRRFAAASDLFDAVVSLGRAAARHRPVSAAIALPALGSAALTSLAAGGTSADPEVRITNLRGARRGG